MIFGCGSQNASHLHTKANTFTAITFSVFALEGASLAHWQRQRMFDEKWETIGMWCISLLDP